MFRHIPNKSLASNTCSKHDTIGANFAQEFKDHLFILASFFVRITYFKDAFRRPLHTDLKPSFLSQLFISFITWSLFLYGNSLHLYKWFDFLKYPYR